VDDILKYVPMHFYLLIIIDLILVAATGNNLGMKLLRFFLTNTEIARSPSKSSQEVASLPKLSR
jgi:hypothetical protein